jgi:PAS domain S-box-containing protein
MARTSQVDPVHVSPEAPVPSQRPAGSRGRVPVASSSLRRYGVAVLATAAGLLFRWSLDTVLEDRVVFLLSMLALLVSAWYGGLGPGLLATGLSASVIWFVLLEPRWTPTVALLADGLSLAIFVVVGIGMSALVAQLHRARDKLEQRVRERTSQLTAINAELIREITERKEIEQTLQEHQQRLRVALESSAVAFTILRTVRDESARIRDFAWLYVNPAASLILGRAPTELIGRRVREVLPGGWDSPGLFECFVHVVETGESRDIEVASAHDGISGWFHNIAAKLGDGLAVWFTDVTERKRAEEQLRRSEAYLAEGQRISHTGSWAVTLPSEDVLWSQEVYRIYGLDPATPQLSQHMAFQLIHPDDRPRVQEAFARALREHSEYAVEHRATLPDGSIKHLHARGHPVLNASGTLTEYVGTVMDITERKRAEAALHEAQAALTHATRLTTLGELTASIAHEVNQPLTAVINNGNAGLRWLTRATPDLEAVREVLRDIVRNGQRAGDVIARIRALAQRTAPQKAWLNLNEVIPEVITLMQGVVHAHHVSLRTDLSATLPPVLGDRVQVQQVLLNLLMNGIEAMHSVTDRPRELWIRAQRCEADTVRVAVQDTGIGLNPHTVDRLFDAFVTTKPEGMGLGLSICRTIIEAHGGRVWASPNDGPGATFLFTLPLGAPRAGGRVSRRHAPSV